MIARRILLIVLAVMCGFGTDSVDLIGLSGQIPATIVVQNGAAGRKGVVMQVLSSGSMTLNSFAAGLGSVVTSIGTIVALRRSRSKTS